MMRKIRLIIGIFCGLIPLLSAVGSQDEFILPKPEHNKKLSHTTLKEKIGTTTQELFDSTTLFEQTIGDVEIALSQVQCQCVHGEEKAYDVLKKVIEVCAECNRACGELHKKLALIQQKCSALGGKLIDDENPFKHASKSMLESTLNILSTTHQRLQHGVGSLHVILPKLTANSDDRVQASIQCVAKELQAQEHMMHGASSAFATDHCLKNS
jgi:hypothetical protein